MHNRPLPMVHSSWELWRLTSHLQPCYLLLWKHRRDALKDKRCWRRNCNCMLSSPDKTFSRGCYNCVYLSHAVLIRPEYSWSRCGLVHSWSLFHKTVPLYIIYYFYTLLIYIYFQDFLLKSTNYTVIILQFLFLSGQYQYPNVGVQYIKDAFLTDISDTW